MKYLIVGGAGMLGMDLGIALGGRTFTSLTRGDLNITDLEATRLAVDGYDVVINAAAYTNVDDAESHELEAYAINATGAQNLAIATAENTSRLVQVSTDYVFDGKAQSPYPESAALNPISAYGRTKAAGETLSRAANPNTIVVRTAWLYGRNGGNFARTLLRRASQLRTLFVVDDQVGQPTWSADVASQIVALIDTGTTSGVFHATSSDQASWFDFARAVFVECNLDQKRVRPVNSSPFQRPAPRPAYSVLGHDNWADLGVTTIRDWRTALTAAVVAGVFVGESP